MLVRQNLLIKGVKSYFRKQNDVPIRTQKLVEQIVDIEWIEVGSDLEALLWKRI